MSAHTPGPWTQEHRAGTDGLYSTEVFDRDGQTIAMLAWHAVRGPNGFSTDREANALLIAAAPDLIHEARHALAFLEDLEASDNPAADPTSLHAPGFFMAVAGLRAAIAKAEGR